MCMLCGAGAPGIGEALLPAIAVASACLYANHEEKIKRIFFVRK